MIWNLRGPKGYKAKAFPIHPHPQAATEAVLCAVPEIVYTPFTQGGTRNALHPLLFSHCMSCNMSEHSRLWDSLFYP